MVVGSVLAFIVALAISGTTGNIEKTWWVHLVVWSIFLIFAWCAVVFAGFYKHTATEKDAEKYRRLVQGDEDKTVSTLKANQERDETENVQVQLEAGAKDQVIEIFPIE